MYLAILFKYGPSVRLRYYDVSTFGWNKPNFLWGKNEMLQIFCFLAHSSVGNKWGHFSKFSFLNMNCSPNGIFLEEGFLKVTCVKSRQGNDKNTIELNSRIPPPRQGTYRIQEIIFKLIICDFWKIENVLVEKNYILSIKFRAKFRLHGKIGLEYAV